VISSTNPCQFNNSSSCYESTSPEIDPKGIQKLGQATGTEIKIQKELDEYDCNGKTEEIKHLSPSDES
jgi:hypothetical protein